MYKKYSEDNLCKELLEHYGKYMLLKIFVDSNDQELINKYIEYIHDRHLKMSTNLYHIDAGFDLFAPEDYLVHKTNKLKIDYNIICSSKIVESNKLHSDGKLTYNTGYYMYPRSSISKSQIRLANSVGIIDSGYRGHLIGMFDCDASDTKDGTHYYLKIQITKFDRYLQICAPGLIPIVVEMVNSKQELGEPTQRGEGGFGSTGK
jgi:dUTP pyrophosphatase